MSHKPVTAQRTGSSQFVVRVAPSVPSLLARSFLSSQRAVAIVGLVLPFSLLAWSLTYGNGVRGSMSEYYYTPMRDVFVGTLTAMGMFFLNYRGSSTDLEEARTDRRLAQMAGVAAIVMALSPLKPRADGPCSLVQCVLGNRMADHLHNGSASLFFGTLMIFCLFRFPRDPHIKRGIKAFYFSAGFVMVLTMGLLLAWQFMPPEILFSWGRFKPVFWLEAVGVTAFAIVWLVHSQQVSQRVMNKELAPLEDDAQ